jgi:hypothetical protein
MTAPEKTPEEVAEESRSAEPDEQPSTTGGKASTVPPCEHKECASDTIQDDGGAYLEPPD